MCLERPPVGRHFHSSILKMKSDHEAYGGFLRPILWTFTETSLLVKFETAVTRETVGRGEIVLTATCHNNINSYLLNYYQIFIKLFIY